MRSGLWFTFLTNVVDESDVLNIFTVKIEQSHEVTELTASSLRISPIVLILSFFLSCMGLLLMFTTRACYFTILTDSPSLFFIPWVCRQILLLHSRQSLTAIQLACLDGDVALPQPVAGVAEAAFAAWSLETCCCYFGCLVAEGLRQLCQLRGRSKELMPLAGLLSRDELSVLTDVVVTELAVWLQCSSCWKCLVAVPQLPEVALLQSVVTGRRLVAECGCWSGGSCASCPVCWAWLPESRGSCPWRSEEPMAPKASRSGLSEMADWLMWSLMTVSFGLRLLYNAWWRSEICSCDYDRWLASTCNDYEWAGHRVLYKYESWQQCAIDLGVSVVRWSAKQRDSVWDVPTHVSILFA